MISTLSLQHTAICNLYLLYLMNNTPRSTQVNKTFQFFSTLRRVNDLIYSATASSTFSAHCQSVSGDLQSSRIAIETNENRNGRARSYKSRSALRFSVHTATDDVVVTTCVCSTLESVSRWTRYVYALSALNTPRVLITIKITAIDDPPRAAGHVFSLRVSK